MFLKILNSFYKKIMVNIILFINFMKLQQFFYLIKVQTNLWHKYSNILIENYFTNVVGHLWSYSIKIKQRDTAPKDEENPIWVTYQSIQMGIDSNHVFYLIGEVRLGFSFVAKNITFEVTIHNSNVDINNLIKI